LVAVGKSMYHPVQSHTFIISSTHIHEQTKPSTADMNYTEDETKKLLPLQPLKEVIKSRRSNEYTLFMEHYRHHRQKEILLTFTSKITCSVVTILFQEKNYKTRNTVVAWFLDGSKKQL